MAAKTRYGSAHFASAQDLKAAGLLSKTGLPFGFTWDKKPKQIRFAADTANLILGAAGSEKLVSCIAYQMMERDRSVILDMKGEIAAITTSMQPWCEIYAFNPYSLWREAPWFLPHHRFNPLEMLDKNAPSFFEDALTLALNLINRSKASGGNSQHFDNKAIALCHAGILCLKEYNENASLIDLFHFIGDIRGGGEEDFFQDLHYPAMKSSVFASVQQMADELLNKRSNAPAEFESILSTVSNSLAILGSPSLQMALSGQSDITAEQFCQPDKSRKFFIIIPAHLMEACAPIIRCIFAAFTIQQQRKPLGQLHMVIDEAAQLGKFDALLRMFAYGRGSKTRVSAIFQNYGQIVENYGKEGTDTLMGNAQTKLILGVASEQTAKFVSDYLGKTTHEYDPYLKQYEAAQKRSTATMQAMRGGNIYQHLGDILQADAGMDNPDSVSRNLLNPDEVMHMDSDVGIASFHGLGIRPYQYRKIPYYQHKDYAHRFLPNPFIAHDHITVPAWFGRTKRVPIITEDVPEAISHLPQYQQAQWSYPKGCKPKLQK
jgi:type IV secretion system protein VirD4